MKWKNNLLNELGWSDTITNKAGKVLVAQQIASKVRDGEVIGVGSGSTVYLALFALAERMYEENLHIRVIPASMESAMTCTRLGIPQIRLWEERPDWTFDGADEVDPAQNLLKGRGGAMFKEKLLISSSLITYIIVDESKFVSRLGINFPVPIEVFPPALPYVEKQVRMLGPTSLSLRLAKGKDGPVITENGNLILDAWFDTIDFTLEKDLKKITGVIENGLFIGYDINLLVARSD